MAGLADLAIIGQSVGPARREPSPYRHSRCTPPSARFDGGWGAVRLLVSLLPTCGKRRVYDRDQNPYPYGRRDRVFDCTFFSFFFSLLICTLLVQYCPTHLNQEMSQCAVLIYIHRIFINIRSKAREGQTETLQKNILALAYYRYWIELRPFVFGPFCIFHVGKPQDQGVGEEKAKPSQATALLFTRELERVWGKIRGLCRVEEPKKAQPKAEEEEEEHKENESPSPV